MYKTRQLSELQKNPELLSEQPEGPNSGYLILQDEDTIFTCCFGFCTYKTRAIHQLPIPQDKDLTMVYTDTNNMTMAYTEYTNNRERVLRKPIVFVPVINQPLSSDCYYAIVPEGPHKGKSLTCSSMKGICVPLNPANLFHQVKVMRRGTSLYVTTCAKNGHAPNYIPRVPWYLDTSDPYHFELVAARGIDSGRRSQLPGLGFPLLCKSSKSVIVGKWYVPFMFVKDGRARDQVERSLYYLMTLEQRWEKIFGCNKDNEVCVRGNSVLIKVEVEKQEVFIAGNKALWSEKNAEKDGEIMFMSYETEGEDLGVGLRVEVFERMKWEQEKGGWKRGKEWKETIERVEEYNGEWKEFGCYVLVERFNLRRMDGSLAMSYDFKHTHQIKAIWE